MASSTAGDERRERALRGAEIMAIEAQGIERVASRLGESFERAIELLLAMTGRVVVSGVGKSGIIGQKLVATLNSTGTPATYMHPTEALHGDLGLLGRGDVAIFLSKSGATDELERLCHHIHRRGLDTRIVAMTANPDSPLGRAAEVVLDISVEREACSFDLAPTTSTTATLALCDALAVTLYEAKGFTEEEFAARHPGGILGRRLLLVLAEIMKQGDAIPTVAETTPFPEVLSEMSRKRLGAVLVVEGERLLGIVTDGDLRRLLERRVDIYAMRAGEMMTRDPMTAPSSMLGSAALVLLESHKRTHLPIVDDGRLRGIVHMHDLIEAGLRP